MISGVCGGETLEIWGVVEGSAQLEANGRALELHTVKFVLLPAMLGAYQLLAVDGPATFLHVYLP
jgi:mannose-6-phosphate isomerase